jgi:acyl dehydratase
MPVMRYYEDFRVGETFDLGRHTFSAQDIKSFAARYDPQPFHLDEAAAARSHFGRLCASGWHTASLWMKKMVEHRQRDADARLARGEASVKMGPSPGFRDLKWLKPVFVGDTVAYATEVIAMRLSGSRPGWGVLSVRNTGVNQNGEPVLSFESATFVECRPGEGNA